MGVICLFDATLSYPRKYIGSAGRKDTGSSVVVIVFHPAEVVETVPVDICKVTIFPDLYAVIPLVPVSIVFLAIWSYVLNTENTNRICPKGQNLQSVLKKGENPYEKSHRPFPDPVYGISADRMLSGRRKKSNVC